MEGEKLLAALRGVGGLREGHFLLSSGLHSGRYLQCALLLQHPHLASEIGESLARKVIAQNICCDLVIGPALGAIIIAHETARALSSNPQASSCSVRSLFAERIDGRFALRRGFQIVAGERALVVEDVITTGGSTLEVIELVNAHAGTVVGVAAIVDRSGGKAGLPLPVISLLELDIENYSPEECPLCFQGLPLDRPGSRPHPSKA